MLALLQFQGCFVSKVASFPFGRASIIAHSNKADVFSRHPFLWESIQLTLAFGVSKIDLSKRESTGIKVGILDGAGDKAKSE
jgi:hypothetical protein